GRPGEAQGFELHGFEGDRTHGIGEPPGKRNAGADRNGGDCLPDPDPAPERQPQARGQADQHEDEGDPLGHAGKRKRSLEPMESVVSGAASASRSGERKPCRLACATTAKTRPDSRARRLPVAESTSSREEHPRASTMPAPNSNPPIAAPDK